MNRNNADPQEVEKFDRLAHSWWDPAGPLKTLHEINPLRLAYIQSHRALHGCTAVDVGCGGGLLSEAMAAAGAHVTGIDLADESIAIAAEHARGAGLQVDYRTLPVETLAATAANSFDVVTCMEMLEHVPEPASIVQACTTLCKPGGHVFFSTLNRHPQAFLFAIVGAEYLLNLPPRGTHEYARFIRPSELAGWSRQAGLVVNELRGLNYNPLTGQHRLSDNLRVNYFMHLRKPDHSGRES
jgi:2-polyprenyl-6-hydroxyphenyl methylase/3-demethylubiquinone-9 3-methyltransferase